MAKIALVAGRPCRTDLTFLSSFPLSALHSPPHSIGWPLPPWRRTSIGLAWGRP